MDENKTWAVTASSFTFHSFGVVHAECRKNIRPKDERRRTEEQVDKAVSDSPHLFRKCSRCAKLEAEYQARTEASMEPVGEYDQVCEGITGYGDAETSADIAAREVAKLELPADVEAEVLESIAQCPSEELAVLFPVADEDAVLVGLNTQLVIDALHAEALKEDAQRTAAEVQAEAETGHEGTVCGAQLYDPFRGLGFCDKREYHYYREGHRGNFDEILSAHAEALDEDAQRGTMPTFDVLYRRYGASKNSYLRVQARDYTDAVRDVKEYEGNFRFTVTSIREVKADQPETSAEIAVAPVTEKAVGATEALVRLAQFLNG